MVFRVTVPETAEETKSEQCYIVKGKGAFSRSLLRVALSGADLHFYHHWYSEPSAKHPRRSPRGVAREVQRHDKPGLKSGLYRVTSLRRITEREERSKVRELSTFSTFDRHRFVFSSETLACQGQRCTFLLKRLRAQCKSSGERERDVLLQCGPYAEYTWW